MVLFRPSTKKIAEGTSTKGTTSGNIHGGGGGVLVLVGKIRGLHEIKCGGNYLYYTIKGIARKGSTDVTSQYGSQGFLIHLII